MFHFYSAILYDSMNPLRFCLSFCLVVFFAVTLFSENLSANDCSVDSLATQAKTKKTKKNVGNPKPTKDSTEYEAYRGMWYGLYFPLGWLVRPSLRGNRGEDDSVFFTAPDSTAEFYVYCPRYSGKPTDIELNRATEEQISQTIEEKEGVRIRTVRIKAKDGSYTRIFEDTVAFIAGRRLVFGFKFHDASALKKHDRVYVYFKSSFRKFVD
jgi:hypothetical protein